MQVVGIDVKMLREMYNANRNDKVNKIKADNAAQVHYKTKIVRCSNVLMCMVDLLILYYCVWLLLII